MKRNVTRFLKKLGFIISIIVVLLGVIILIDYIIYENKMWGKFDTKLSEEIHKELDKYNIDNFIVDVNPYEYYINDTLIRLDYYIDSTKYIVFDKDKYDKYENYRIPEKYLYNTYPKYYLDVIDKIGLDSITFHSIVKLMKKLDTNIYWEYWKIEGYPLFIKNTHSPYFRGYIYLDSSQKHLNRIEFKHYSINIKRRVGDNWYKFKSIPKADYK